MVRSSVLVGLYTVYTSSDSEITFAWRFDTANAIKSCVRVLRGQSSEFLIYPITFEHGIIRQEWNKRQ